ncbi:MAG: hypothetical protein MUP16_07345 [Sedimentisphaerales bacterium]|nr:hypothetical protein [Sedimentisphaerales bacterium]
MNNGENNNRSQRPYLAMWGVRNQRCCHGNAMVASTVMSLASVEILCGELFPKVVEADTDQTVQFDRRILGELEPSGLFEQAKIALLARPELSLPPNLDLMHIVEKSDLLKALAAGRKPQMAEELARAIKLVCQESGQHVCWQFDSAVEKSPSKVDGVTNDLVDTIDQMGHAKSNGGHALLQFEKRAEQFKVLPSLTSEIKESTFQKLKKHLLQKAQGEYSDVLKQWTEDLFWQCWKKECDRVKERCEKFRQDSQAFRSKVRLCCEDCSRSYHRDKERLTTLKAGNQVVLEEASKDELRAALMANRKVGGPLELIYDIRHEFEKQLRECAERRGMGQQNVQQMPFRALVLALPIADLVDSFKSLVLDNISDGHSFYHLCQSYGLERLVSELSKRSRITSWFDGRDDQRFGITRFEVRMVRLPKPVNSKDGEIKEVLESLFQREGFQDILSDGQARSISALRVYAGWPLGIEGANPVLLEAYKRSVHTGHLPHLVGILPDTSAGEHAPGIVKL